MLFRSRVGLAVAAALELWSWVGVAASALRTAIEAASATRPKTVKLCGSSAAELSARLKKNWSVALLGSAGPPGLELDSAMAMVPAVFEAENSPGTFGPTGIDVRVVPPEVDCTVAPPP